MAQDSNENLLPDPGPQDPAEMACDGSTCVWTSAAYSISVSDSTGQVIGELGILDPVVTLTIRASGGLVVDLEEGRLVGTVGSQALIGLVMTVGGIDEEGVTNLLKSVYEIPEGEDLPPTLPFSFRMTYVKVD
jgi:hypothetical protein